MSSSGSVTAGREHGVWGRAMRAMMWAVLAVAAVAAACSGPGAGPGPGGGGLASRGCQAVPAGAVVARHNAARAQAGLGPLASDPVLARVAAARACDMAAAGYFSHRDSAGRSAGERVRAAGIERCTIAENIAMGQPDAGAVSADWMASPGHRANILRAGAVRVGAAAAVVPAAATAGGDGLVRWVTIFAGPCLQAVRAARTAERPATRSAP